MLTLNEASTEICSVITSLTVIKHTVSYQNPAIGIWTQLKNPSEGAVKPAVKWAMKCGMHHLNQQSFQTLDLSGFDPQMENKTLPKTFGKLAKLIL